MAGNQQDGDTAPVSVPPSPTNSQTPQTAEAPPNGVPALPDGVPAAPLAGVPATPPASVPTTLPAGVPAAPQAGVPAALPAGVPTQTTVFPAPPYGQTAVVEQPRRDYLFYSTPTAYAYQTVQGCTRVRTILYVAEAPPENYLLISLTVCLCCNWCFGIIPVSYSLLSIDAANRGDFDSAEQLGQTAKLWSFAVFVASLIAGFLLLTLIGVRVIKIQ